MNRILRFLRLSVCAVLVMLSGAGLLHAQDYSGLPGRKLVCTYTVGDAMGDVKNSITKQEHFFVGDDNRPVRGCLLGSGTGSEFTLTKYYRFNPSTDDGGNAVMKYYMSQWGAYDFGDMGLKAPALQETVTVAADGKVLKRVTQSYAYAYEYDDAGQLIKETWTIAASGALSKRIEYVNGASGRPTSAIEYNSKEQFACKYVYDYDEEGNLIEKMTYKRTTVTDENTEYLNVDELYVYEGGRQTEYIKYGSGSATADPKLTSRKTYEVYNGNPDKVLEISYTSPKTDGEGNTTWKKSATAYVYEYADFTENGRTAWAIDDLKAEAATDRNDVVLTFSAPQHATADTKFAIMRSGVPVAVVSAADVRSADGKCSYTETGVRLGEWEYFVIPFEGQSLLDVTANTQRYMSNLASVKVQTHTLKAVQGLCFEVKKEEYVQKDDELGNIEKTAYVITLKWDANDGLATSTFKGHTPYFAKVLTNGQTSNMMLSAGDITDPAVTTFSFDYLDSYDEMRVFMVSHFEEGNAVSDTISILKADLDKLAEGPSEPFMAYGLATSWDGALTASFDMSAVNAEVPATVTKGERKMAAICNDLKCATAVGDKYVMFYDDVNYNTSFATVNFTTGNVVDVNNYAYKYGKPGSMMQSLAYDAPSSTLYGLEKAYDEASDDYVTVIYTVDPDNGSLTEVARYATVYEAIVADGKGSLYLIRTTMNAKFQPVPTLWKLDEAFDVAETPAVDNAETGVTYSMANSSVASPDGTKIYYITGQQVNVFDLAAGTFGTVGELDALVYGIANAPGTVDGVATEAPKNADARKMVCKTWYGDSMGTLPSTQDMTQECYFYNYDGKLARVAKYGRGYHDDGTAGDYELTYYTKNLLDDQANILKSTRYQRGLYDYGDFAMKQVSETTYEYDALGHMVKETTPAEIYGYEYDEAGNIVRKTVTNAYTGMEVQTIEYMDFIALNKPTAAISDGAYDNYKYVATINYDDNLNKTLEMHSKMVEDPDFGMTMPMPFEAEEWVYEGDMLVTDTKYYFDNQGQAVPAMRTTYAAVDGNPDKVQSVDETYFDGKWYTQAGSTCVIDYAEFSDEMLEMTWMEMLAQPDETVPGAVQVLFSLPQVAYMSNTQIAVYRDGEKVAQEDAVNFYDFESGICSFTDTGVKNGTHEYFVQPVVGVGDEMGENVQWTGYCITYPQEVEAYTELPAVTDLHMVAAREETTTEGFNQYKTKWATIAWTNPAERPDGFRSNDIIFEGMQVAEVTVDDAEATQMDTELMLDESTPEVKLFVLSRYALGNAKSETLTIQLEEFNTLVTGIDAVSDATGTFRFAGNVFAVDGTADLTVYNAAGQLMEKASDANAISLEGLSDGTYVVLVRTDRGVRAFKVTKH